ncbi:MAG: omega-6 fatty acid desaturase (delta-12 desaturase) [Hyphomicrobiaceae bacterium]|jgi:omega-6 fatty acid desaturase (delta-12 desaturase)
MGIVYFGTALVLTSVGVVAATCEALWLWCAGQVVLALAFQSWWVLLHEAGHDNLFRTRWLNRGGGVIAGFFALIPSASWRLVHRDHHRWTGWQDKDLTTESLVPRPLGRSERVLANTCWKLWLPLFSTVYRLGNFWNVPRLWRRYPDSRRRMVTSVAVLLLCYTALIWIVGPAQLTGIAGLGVLLGMALQDPLILSQHTHVPMNVSNGASKVRPFTPLQQEEFTRSLAFPTWLGRGILMNVGAHELHHMYPAVPAYDLHKIDYEPRNLVNGLRWIARAKRVPADVFLFQNRNTSGLDL